MSRLVSEEVEHTMEGWEGRVLFAYDDAIFPPRPAKVGDKIHGTLTAGCGHVGKDVYVGMTVTNVMVDMWMEKDLAHSEANVESKVRVQLNDNQYGALVDFDFNAGDGALASSTLLKKVNANDFAAVPAEFKKWNHTTINGKLVVSAGLTKRCAARAALWSLPLNTPHEIVKAIVDPGVTGQYANPAPPHPASIPASAGATAVIVAAGAVATGMPPDYLAWVAIGAVVAAIVVVLVVLKSRKA